MGAGGRMPGSARVRSWRAGSLAVWNAATPAAEAATSHGAEGEPDSGKRDRKRLLLLAARASAWPSVARKPMYPCASSRPVAA